MKSCSHLEQVNLGVEAKTKGCEECEKIGDTWVHLRLCLSCGHVGCCDSSKNKHGTKHFKQTGHPVMVALHNRHGNNVLLKQSLMCNDLTRLISREDNTKRPYFRP